NWNLPIAVPSLADLAIGLPSKHLTVLKFGPITPEETGNERHLIERYNVDFTIVGKDDVQPWMNSPIPDFFPTRERAKSATLTRLSTKDFKRLREQLIRLRDAGKTNAADSLMKATRKPIEDRLTLDRPSSAYAPRMLAETAASHLRDADELTLGTDATNL